MRHETDKSRKSSFVSYKTALVAVLALGFTIGLTGCKEETAVTEPVRPVKAMVVEAAPAQRTVLYSGVIAPRVETSLGFRVSGKIVERLVNVGDAVRAGQPVARLDETDLRLGQNSAEAAVTSARSRLAVANDALQRARSLAPKGFIAQSVVDQRQLEADSAKAALDAAQDQLEQARNATSYALLLADKPGIITSVRAEPGQVVSVGQTVVTLAQAGDIEVSVAIPEHEIARLSPGMPAQVALWAAPEIRSSGTVREIAGAAEPASRTYAVRVALANPSEQMRLGMTATVSLSLDGAPPGVTIPLAALREFQGQKTVFVADRDGTVAARMVQVASVNDDGARIETGLAPGEVVVTGGVQFLRDGMKVRLPAGLEPPQSAMAGH
jgi:RND family efflux transporter MFP subunit